VPSSIVDPMSDETAQRLEEATVTQVERRAEADDRKRECLTAVACGIPARVEEIAKRAAQGQPEVAKELGSDGIKDLRRELSSTDCLVEGDSATADLGQDGFCGGGPDESFGLVVMDLHVFLDRGDQVRYGVEYASA
jgi:hypothetical protein